MSHVSYENLPRATVRGDWLPDSHPGYPARIAGLWNGWADPLVTAEVAQQVVKDQEALRAELDEPSRHETEELSWDDERRAIVATYHAETPPMVTVIDGMQVGDERLYGIGFGWTWDVVERDALPRPSEDQREVIDFLRSLDWGAEAELATYSVRVLEDGTASIPVQVPGPPHRMDDGRVIGSRVTESTVHVHPDGTYERLAVD